MTEQQNTTESNEDVEAHGRKPGRWADAEGAEGSDDVEGHGRKPGRW